MKQGTNILGTGLLVSATIIAGTILCSSSTDASSTSANASITIAEACTMSSTVTTPHTATISPNTYQADIGVTTINVVCNDPQGYAIYGAGYTGDEIGGTNSTKLVGPSSSIDTGTATSGSTSNWAMKINTSGSSFVGTIDNGFGSYHAVPSEYTKVAHFNSATDVGTGVTGSTYQTTYAAFVSGTQGAGNYVGKVKYTMIHPANEFVPHEVACYAGYICYNPNTAIVEGKMGRQSAENNSSRFLYAPNFKKQGYGFAGWSDAYDYETNSNANFYGPNETITAPADVSTNGLSLYAVWIKSAGSLQNWEGCSSLTQGAVTALTDERDRNTYAVAKLADGKCWMIENLRLDDVPTLSTNNTHNPSLPLTNIYDSGVTSNHISPSSSVEYDATTKPEGWCNSFSAACIDQSRLRTDNTVLFTNNTSSNYSTTKNVYSYGNYYNWYSATAGHGKYDTSTNNYSTVGDICPAGWHLPKGGNKSNEANNEFWQLVVTGLNNGVKPANYDSNLHPYFTGRTTEAAPISKALRSYPNNFIHSGGSWGSTINDRNANGRYWSSSANSTGDAYYLFLYDNDIYPGTWSHNKYYGLSVRCIAGE